MVRASPIDQRWSTAHVAIKSMAHVSCRCNCTCVSMTCLKSVSTILAQDRRKAGTSPNSFSFHPPTIPERSESLLITNTKGLSEKLVESIGQLQMYTSSKLGPHITEASSGRRLTRAWTEALRQHTETQKMSMTSQHEEGLDLLMLIVESASAIMLSI